MRRQTAKQHGTQPQQSPGQPAQRLQALRRSLLAATVRDIGSSRSQPIDTSTRETMDTRFGYDFGNVQVHTDERAAELAEGVGARAFTFGNHIVFGRRQYAPATPTGQRLLAHELTHVVQQNPQGIGAGERGQPADVRASRIGDATEVEASMLASDVVSGKPVIVRQHAERALQGDWTDVAIGAGLGALAGAVVGGLAGGPVGALVGAGVGAAAGAAIGGVAGATSIFPSYSEIVADADVQSFTDTAWSNTKAAATATSRREEGFWLRLNMGTHKYEKTSTVLGPSIGPSQTGSVVLGARPADANAGAANAIYTVASFHTHTPTAFRPVGRPIGPSDADGRADTSDDVVGVVYDYVESPAGSGDIPAGHPLNSAAQRYHSGPNRRQRQ